MTTEVPASVDGTVIEVMGRGTFRVRLDNNDVVFAYSAGKTRKTLLTTVAGDRVSVQIAADGPARGRILQLRAPDRSR
jgi:translation initiation factor IF-1